MPFDGKPFKVLSSDGHTFELMEDVTYTTEVGEAIIIPAGATSDGASTPRMLWRELPPFGDYWRAAFLHDHLYRSTDKTKEQCDYLLLEAMASLDVFKLTRDLIYQGVVNCGQWSFDIDRKMKKPTTPILGSPPTPT